MKGTKSKFSIGKLFYNDKFVMLFSIVLAFILWINVSATSQETRYLTVTDIPVSLPELGNDLQFFGAENQTAEVRISGNSLVVASVTSSDIYITAADTSKLTSPGKYSVDLVPKKGSVKTDYTFESTVKPSKIDVFVDRYDEREFTITDKIDVSAVADGYYAATTVISPQTVTVKGAKSIIASIAEVDAVYSVTEPISETKTIEAPIELVDNKGEKIAADYISTDIMTVSATIPVLTIKAVDVVPTIINAPDSFVYDSSIIKVDPATIELAVPKEDSDSVNSIKTEEIDISKINAATNTLEVGLNISAGYRNLSQVTTAKITFDKDKLLSKKLTLNKFTVINEGENRKTTVLTKSIPVTIVGAADQIKTLSTANVTAVVDMSSKSSFSGKGSMPVSISINSKYPFCWQYGSSEVDVMVEETNSDSSANQTSSKSQS